MKTNIYLNFDGNCAEAFDLYKSVFGGDFLFKQTFGSSPMKDQVPPQDHNHIIHVSLPLGENGVQLMGSDYSSFMNKKEYLKGTNMQVSLSVESKDEADRIFTALAASPDHPMQDMFWGSYYGYCTDNFGIQWMIDCAPPVADDKKQQQQQAIKG